MSPSDLLTIDEVAALLRVRPSWVYARTCAPSSGKDAARFPKEVADPLPFIRIGRLLRFRRGEIESWLERHVYSSVKTSSKRLEDAPQANENKGLN
jgi:predicted DNA-binding transcriptional regulator AlpA